MIAHLKLFWAIPVLCALISSSYAFSFTVTAPTQCDDLKVSWTGGIPPFSLVMYPLFGTQRNVSIPSTAFSNGAGSFSFQLPFPSGHKFVITMSDATGYGSGGTTNVQTTGASHGGSCNTTDPGVNFPFELNSALQQCRPYIFSGYGGAIQPVTIIGTIPGGESFLLVPPIGSVTYDWNANVAAGTSLLFTMVDARGRFGGTSDIKTVGITDDATCVNSSSPSSTAASSSTSTSAPSTTINSQTPSATVSTSTTPEPEHNTSTAAIAGTVIGGLVFLAVAVTLGLFFLRKRRDHNNNKQSRNTDLDLTYDPAHTYGNYPYSSGAGAGASASSAPGGDGYDQNPFSDTPQQPYHQAGHSASSSYTPSQYQAQSQYPNLTQFQAYSDHHAPSLYQQPSLYQPSQHSLLPYHSQQRSLGSERDSFNPYTLTSDAPSVIQPFEVSDAASTTMSTAQRKAAMAGVSVYQPSRFIVHTDVEDELPPPNQDGIVELPPRYSERRGAPTTSTAADGGPSHAETTLGS